MRAPDKLLSYWMLGACGRINLHPLLLAIRGSNSFALMDACDIAVYVEARRMRDARALVFDHLSRARAIVNN